MNKIKAKLSEEALEYAKSFIELASQVATNATTGNDGLSSAKLKEIMNTKTDVFVNKILDIVKPE